MTQEKRLKIINKELRKNYNLDEIYEICTGFISALEKHQGKELLKDFLEKVSTK